MEIPTRKYGPEVLAAIMAQERTWAVAVDQPEQTNQPAPEPVIPEPTEAPAKKGTMSDVDKIKAAIAAKSGPFTAADVVAETGEPTKAVSNMLYRMSRSGLLNKPDAMHYEPTQSTPAASESPAKAAKPRKRQAAPKNPQPSPRQQDTGEALRTLRAEYERRIAVIDEALEWLK